MNRAPASRSNGVPAAMLAAALMIAHQVAGRATRDALFLSHFPVTALPIMVMIAAAVSLVLVLGGGPLFTRVGPHRLVPAGFAASALLHLGEWGVASISPRTAAVLVYLHSAVLGLFLISAFWSLVTERFDPRTARRRIGGITAGASLGGLVGGLAAAQLGTVLSVTGLLPFLALLHFAAMAATAWFLRGTASLRPLPRARKAGEDEAPRFGLAVLGKSPYLRDLALLTLLGTVAAACLDYTFKAAAVGTFSRGAGLLRFFALYHGGVSVAAFLVQSGFSRVFLERIGLARTVAALPLAVFGIGIPAAVVPGLPVAAAARGAEAVVRNSLYRSAYELHYTPIPKSRKRAAKALIDVGFERLGDGLGGGLVQLVLVAAPLAAMHVLPVLAAALSLGLLFLVVPRLQRGYVGALEESLLKRAPDLDADGGMGGDERASILMTLSGLKLDPAFLSEIRKRLDAPPVASSSTSPAEEDPLLARISELRSRDRARVHAALTASPGLEPALVPHVIPLLAWDEVAEDAARALAGTGPRIAGQLADAFLDPRGELTVRRRLPRVLAELGSPMVAGCLFRGLGDRRFEVRLQSGRALARLVAGGIPPPASAPEIFAVVLREVEVDRKVWEGRRLLASREAALEDSRESLFVDEVLKARADRSLEHVFTLLSLALPREPLRIAFRGLHTADSVLRGTALEYLESVLPAEIRARLWPFLEDPGRAAKSARSSDEILQSLLQSNESIQVHLAELRKNRGPGVE